MQNVLSYIYFIMPYTIYGIHYFESHSMPHYSVVACFNLPAAKFSESPSK